NADQLFSKVISGIDEMKAKYLIAQIKQSDAIKKLANAITPKAQIAWEKANGKNVKNIVANSRSVKSRLA
ncbi:MAG: hypothetical protein FWC45_03650, partial [Treponema sp.]|nr:hypothetical protein [Treponema sp.]